MVVGCGDIVDGAAPCDVGYYCAAHVYGNVVVGYICVCIDALLVICRVAPLMILFCVDVVVGIDVHASALWCF